MTTVPEKPEPAPSAKPTASARTATGAEKVTGPRSYFPSIDPRSPG